jgi:hypothetical protein
MDRAVARDPVKRSTAILRAFAIPIARATTGSALRRSRRRRRSPRRRSIRGTSRIAIDEIGDIWTERFIWHARIEGL